MTYDDFMIYALYKNLYFFYRSSNLAQSFSLKDKSNLTQMIAPTKLLISKLCFPYEP